MLESGISEMRNTKSEVVQIEFSCIDTSEMDITFEFEKMLLKEEEIKMR